MDERDTTQNVVCIIKRKLATTEIVSADAIQDNDFISFVDEWKIDLSSNGTPVNYKIDSGSQANILPFDHLAKPPKLNQTKVSLLAYNSTDIPIKGSCIVNIEHNNRNIPPFFLVADIILTTYSWVEN